MKGNFCTCTSFDYYYFPLRILLVSLIKMYLPMFYDALLYDFMTALGLQSPR